MHAAAVVPNGLVQGTGLTSTRIIRTQFSRDDRRLPVRCISVTVSCGVCQCHPSDVTVQCSNAPATAVTYLLLTLVTAQLVVRFVAKQSVLIFEILYM